MLTFQRNMLPVSSEQENLSFNPTLRRNFAVLRVLQDGYFRHCPLCEVCLNVYLICCTNYKGKDTISATTYGTSHCAKLIEKYKSQSDINEVSTTKIMFIVTAFLHVLSVFTIIFRCKLALSMQYQISYIHYGLPGFQLVCTILKKCYKTFKYKYSSNAHIVPKVIKLRSIVPLVLCSTQLLILLVLL